MLNIKDGKIVEKEVRFDKPSTNLCIKLADDTYFDGITVFVILEANGHTLTLSCAEFQQREFYCKVDIAKEMLSSKPATLHVVIQYLGSTQITPKITATFSVNKILLGIDQIRDKAYTALKSELDGLKEQLKILTGGGIHNIMPKDFELSTITQGAVWTVIDNKGNCAFIQPFIKNVEKVNGKECIGREITIFAEDIKTKDGNVQEVADKVSMFEEIKGRLEAIERHLFGDEGLR